MDQWFASTSRPAHCLQCLRLLLLYEKTRGELAEKSKAKLWHPG